MNLDHPAWDSVRGVMDTYRLHAAQRALHTVLPYGTHNALRPKTGLAEDLLACLRGDDFHATVSTGCGVWVRRTARFISQK